MSLLTKDSDTTKLLLLRIAEGDEEALKTLIINYTPLLAPFIYNFTKSKERTEELVQDIFMQVWMARDTLPLINNINGFLYVLAKNYALNAVRGLLREQQRLAKYGEIQAEEAEADNARQPVELPGMNLIEEAIHTLPPQQQKAWILSRRQGKNYAEIAVDLQVSKASVKKYIQWANATIIKYVRARIDLLLAGIILVKEGHNNFFK